MPARDAQLGRVLLRPRCHTPDGDARGRPIANNAARTARRKTPAMIPASRAPGDPSVSEGRSGADPTAAPKHYWLTCLGSGPCLGALRYVCFVGLTDRGQFCFLVWVWSVRELASARDCARWVPLPPVRVCPRTPSKLLEPWIKDRLKSMKAMHG